MARRVTPSQYRSMVRQAQARRRQAIQKFNRELRQVEQKINREIQQRNQRRKRAIDQYNRDIRAYNRQVETNRARIRSALQTLSRIQVTTQYTVIYRSTQLLSQSYARLRDESVGVASSKEFEILRGYAEQETANSLDVTNVLLGETPEEDLDDDLALSAITSELAQISGDLDHRWHGAVYALSPRNPDAARHFCTSAREIMTTILDLKAPYAAVEAAHPGCQKTAKGTPTRRARIDYCLARKGLGDDALASFVDSDIGNVVDLFHVLSAGTHGPASKYGLDELQPLKRRVEDAILFLSKIVD